MTVQYKSKGGSRRGIEGRAAQTVLIICLLITLFLTLLPVIITIFLSFKSQLDMTTGSIWSLPQDGWHFDNYANAFSGTIRYMLNTLAIVFISVFVTMLLSCYVAYLFVQKDFAAKNVLFFLIILPMLVPSVVLLSPTFLTIVELNLQGSWWGLILPYIAGNQIATIFLLRTFIGQQPKDLYEAASIDGATWWKKVWHACRCPFPS